MTTKINIRCLMLIVAIMGSYKSMAQVHANDNLWYNNGAEVYIGTGALVTVQGDVTNNQVGITGITHLNNNGFLWVQGNMYGDSAFKQAGNGVARLQNKTALYTAPYATENYQVIQGGYRVNGGQSAIAASDDGSFYNLELDNQNGQVFVKSNTDVRNSVDFKPSSVTVDGATIDPTGTKNRLITCDPASIPSNGIGYTATFGMMNSAAGLSNFKNLSINLTRDTAILDSAYVQGKLRRALDATSGGSYGFPLGLEPSISNTAARGIQYAKLDFAANTYDVLSGYFQQGSNNTDSTPSSVCSITENFLYYGSSNHGEWVFTPLIAANNPYDITIYPQDYGITSSSKYFITKDNDVPVPGTQSCANSPLGLDVTGLTGFPVSEFGFAGGESAIHNADINVTYINVPVSGDVSTNDKSTPGSTYGNPSANINNPSDCMPVMNADGSGKYTFVCDSVGTYIFNVPVCEPGGTPCKLVPLTITVLDSKDTTAAPIANPDYATAKEGSSITIPVAANDMCQNGPNCTLGTPTVVNLPKHGTFDPITNVYTPTTGFVGNDTLLYSVCDNQVPSKCDTAFVYITVIPANSPNNTTAADDYVQAPYGVPVSGNAKANDNDPEKNLQNITPQTTTEPGKGTLVLNADGTYTFSPVPDFSGPVSFTYTTCDTVSAPNTACASATLHILVEPKKPVHTSDSTATLINIPVTGDVSTNDEPTTGTTYGNPAVNTSNPSNCAPVMNADGSGKYTFNCNSVGTYIFKVPVCEPGGTPCDTVPLTITVSAIPSAPLPVRLTSFIAASVDKCTAKLNWVSATELNVKSYELQFSKNGVDFTTVHTVIPTGSNSNYSQVYQPEFAGYSSYRLKIIDNDGSASYSKTVQQQTNCNVSDATVSVFPNPVSVNTNIKVNSGSSLLRTKVVLLDTNGKLVKQKTLINSTELLDMNDLPSGIYFLKFADGTVKKLVKK